jgi:hypothetical protein
MIMEDDPRDGDEWLYPILAPGVLVIGWGAGQLLGISAASPFLRFYSAISHRQSFVSNSLDLGIAMVDVLIALCATFYAGWLVAPHKKAGVWPWLMLPIVLLMLGADFIVRSYFMGLPSFKAGYWDFIQQSLPLGLGSVYLCFPFIGLVSGFLGSMIWRKRQYSAKNAGPVQHGRV